MGQCLSCDRNKEFKLEISDNEEEEERFLDDVSIGSTDWNKGIESLKINEEEEERFQDHNVNAYAPSSSTANIPDWPEETGTCGEEEEDSSEQKLLENCTNVSMSSPDIAGMLDQTKEIDRLRKEQEDVILEINKMHKKLQSTPEVVEKPGDNSLARLKMLYMQAKELSESEVTVSGQLLSQLDALIPSGHPGQQRRRIEGNEQKKKRMKSDSDVPRLSPSVRNHLDALASLKGEQVAARVTQEKDDKDEWFIVKVIHFDRETREFEVLDEEPGDDEEASGQRKYKLPMSHIIPFPKRNDPSTAQDFSPRTHVLAVYPGTTALYKATVVNTRKRKTDDYILEFDDDEEDGSLPQRSVPFHRVVTLPEGHRQ